MDGTLKLSSRAGVSKQKSLNRKTTLERERKEWNFFGAKNGAGRGGGGYSLGGARGLLTASASFVAGHTLEQAGSIVAVPGL